MTKLFVVHYYPADYFPPVMNFVDTLADKADLVLVSMRKANALKEYTNSKIRIDRPVSESKSDTSWKVLVKYCYFTLFTLLKLLLYKPDIIIYYESVSALAPYLYKRLFRKKIKICIHYHEYMTETEYKRPGMRISDFNHQLEVSYLYSRADWISQTNEKRKELFMNDYPFIAKVRCRLLPNYPPENWFVASKTHINETIKCVYIGSLSLTDTFIEKFCAWVARQNGKVIFDIYSFNFHVGVKKCIENTHSPFISFHECGILYQEIPKLLAKYDVGLLLYKATALNFQYNETNKFYEYLINGLDVWYPKEMLLLHNMDKSQFGPDIVEMDFGNIDNFIPFIRTYVNNRSYNWYAETVYSSFFDEVVQG